jgi:branched-subunit amino acid transport protein AzlD
MDRIPVTPAPKVIITDVTPRHVLQCLSIQTKTVAGKGTNGSLNVFGLTPLVATAIVVAALLLKRNALLPVFVAAA